jgi:hypothetical protein
MCDPCPLTRAGCDRGYPRRGSPLPGFRYGAPQALCRIAQITPVAARVLRGTDWSKETPTPPTNDRYLRIPAGWTRGEVIIADCDDHFAHCRTLISEKPQESPLLDLNATLSRTLRRSPGTSRRRPRGRATGSTSRPPRAEGRKKRRLPRSALRAYLRTRSPTHALRAPWPRATPSITPPSSQTSGADLSTRASRRKPRLESTHAGFPGGRVRGDRLRSRPGCALHDPRIVRCVGHPRRRSQHRRIDRVAQGRTTGQNARICANRRRKGSVRRDTGVFVLRRAGAGSQALGLHRNSGVLQQIEQRLPVLFGRLHDEVESGAVFERR